MTISFMKKHKYYFIIIIVLIIVFILSILGIYKCPYRLLFGIPCPTCGLTRAFISLLSFDFKSAFKYHSLYFLVIIGFIFYTLEEFNIISISNKIKNIFIVICIILFMIYYIYRIINRCLI
jgi:hypothetical protein